jgi:uncharacterized cupin superfamily protein
VGITHFDDAPAGPLEFGHLRGTWTPLGEAAGSVGVGVRRIQVPAGAWSTPAHEHGSEEEIFYVLAGSGLSWQKGRAAEVRAGDCIVYHPARGAHSVHAGTDIDVLAFGPRRRDESVGFPRLGMSLVGTRAVDTVARSIDGAPIQFVREAEIGPPELPATPDPRPSTIANVDDVEPQTIERARVHRTRRNLGNAVGSVSTGLQHVTVAPGADATLLHCHSVEEEIFVILDGDGILLLHDSRTGGETEAPVKAGHVVSRPPATGVAHLFRAGAQGLTFLAYGTRAGADTCYYPRSGKIAFRGLGLVARLEKLDYWDGEE